MKHIITEFSITGEYPTTIFFQVRILSKRFLRKNKITYHQGLAPKTDTGAGVPRFTDHYKPVYDIYNAQLTKDIQNRINQYLENKQA